jgi:hypothetical protein
MATYHSNYSIRISDAELNNDINEFLKQNPRYTFSSLVRDALKTYLTKEGDEWTVLFKRLNRQDKEVKDLKERYEMLAEILMMYLRYYFVLTQEIPEESLQATDLKDTARKRYNNFLKAVQSQLSNEGSIVEQIFSSVQERMRAESENEHQGE